MGIRLITMNGVTDKLLMHAICIKCELHRLSGFRGIIIDIVKVDTVK